MPGNAHLNLFRFFNDDGKQYLENNLSRAFALCLRYDSLFLSQVLRHLLEEELFNNTFSIDFTNRQVKVDLQRTVKELAGYNRLIAVACSGDDLPISEAVMAEISGYTAESPITDVTIELEDTCIIFEFKRDASDCRSQLKGQVEALKRSAKEMEAEEDLEVRYLNYSWKDIVRTLLQVRSLQKQMKQQSFLIEDFIDFLEVRHPQWFPKRLLKDITYPNNNSDPNAHYLHTRLDQLKAQVYGDDALRDIGQRTAIYHPMGWANEIHLDRYQSNDEQYLVLIVFPGDTKAQGIHFFKKWKEFEPPKKINGYQVNANWYLKLSHFTSGIMWIRPDEQERRHTHNAAFFWKYAGRKKKERGDWDAFAHEIDQIMPPDWKKKSGWISHIEQSNRTYFDLSIGVELNILIPYEEAQELDNSQADSSLAVKLRTCAEALQSYIDHPQHQ